MKKQIDTTCACEAAEKRVRERVSLDAEFALNVCDRQYDGDRSHLGAVLAHISATRRDLAQIRALDESLAAVSRYVATLAKKTRR